MGVMKISSKEHENNCLDTHKATTTSLPFLQILESRMIYIQLLLLGMVLVDMKILLLQGALCRGASPVHCNFLAVLILTYLQHHSLLLQHYYPCDCLSSQPYSNWPCYSCASQHSSDRDIVFTRGKKRAKSCQLT